MPSARLRKLEVEANNAFDQYRDLWVPVKQSHGEFLINDECCPLVTSDMCFFRYFEGGVSSVYLWDLDHGFAGVILIKKAGDGSKKIKGCWDSIHVVEVQVRISWDEMGWHLNLLPPVFLHIGKREQLSSMQFQKKTLFICTIINGQTLEWNGCHIAPKGKTVFILLIYPFLTSRSHIAQ